MYGFSPFLGHVRLASGRLGQADQLATMYEEQIRTLTTRARPLSNADELFAAGNVCYAQAATLRSATTSQDVSAREADVQKCINALRTRVEAAEAARSAPPSQASPVSSASAASAGINIPTWGAILGGAAIAGLLVYAVTK